MSYTVTVEQVYRQTVEVFEAVSESDAVDIALRRASLLLGAECAAEHVIDVTQHMTREERAEQEQDRWR